MVILGGCSLFNDRERPLFENIPPSYSGITFSNTISYDKNFNVLNYPYIYNGGGVAAGDINNDGLTDLYFTGNMVSSRLYLNKGHFKFKDITQSSGTSTNCWAGGASMVDINSDGYLDIYVSVTGTSQSNPRDRANLLYINNGDNTFTESAAKYGLDNTGFTTHAAFFDYDHDGDLDAFMINNFAGSFSRDSKTRIRREHNEGSSKSADALYRNNGNGTFTDVSREAGILNEGYSLGLAVRDINRDGWTDIYISDDVQTDDVLYINNGDGTFTDKAAEYFKHTSYAGMGTDVADFNNDGWPDILQVDMRPESLHDQQLVSGGMSYERFSQIIRAGYQYQYLVNSLQLSNGIDEKGNVVFSEIGKLAGVATTDWSWSGLFADFDNDGLKDIMVTNGYPKAVNHYDYRIKLSRSSMFGTDSARKEQSYETMHKLGAIKLPNRFYQNNGDLTFTDVSKRWGFANSTFSYGAAYADLDNDGDLDIIINNVDDKAQILKNTVDSSSHHHYLEVHLAGDSLNPGGVGSQIMISAGGKNQYATMQPYRGYQSTVERNIHFGLGVHKRIDTLQISWPDGAYQQLTHIKGDTLITLAYENAGGKHELKAGPKISKTRFGNVTHELDIQFKHKENTFNDYKREPLLPYMFSRLGPGIAAGDVNKDGREDIYIGGAAGQPGRLYLQQTNGSFTASVKFQPWNSDRAFEDMGALFFDADGDGALDLYVVSGGTALSPLSAKLQDRLYLNDGHGRFARSKNRLPQMYTSGSCVIASDFDGDGDLDLFVGGRIIPGKYPLSPRSYILRNDNGTFKDVTEKMAPQLERGGLITDALWVDFDGDGKPDLVTAGEWSPICIYKNEGDRFESVTEATGLAGKTGWWNSLAKGDFDHDGDMDLVAGNFGLNSRYASDAGARLQLIVSDADNNQQENAIIAFGTQRGLYPIAGKLPMMEQVRSVSHQFPTFEAYANADVGDIIGEDALEGARRYKVNRMASIYLENNGKGSFLTHPLPTLAQISSVNDIIPYDVNEDGYLDIIVAGNNYNMEPQTPRNDAGNGLWLKGDGKGHFKPVPPIKSGFLASGDVKDLQLINVKGRSVLLVANNNDTLRAYKISYADR